MYKQRFENKITFWFDHGQKQIDHVYLLLAKFLKAYYLDSGSGGQIEWGWTARNSIARQKVE